MRAPEFRRRTLNRAAMAAVWLSISGWSFLYAQIKEPPPEPDPLLRAMQDELHRSLRLRIISLDLPYFIEYRVAEESNFSLSASLGALVASSQATLRIPMVRVRVGDYNFDNTNHMFSDAYSGSRYDPDQLPLDDDYMGFRRALWLATDRAYKTAEDAIARKRSSLKNMNMPDRLPDFTKQSPVRSVLPVHIEAVKESLWKDRVVKLSGIFDRYPRVLSSGVDLQVSQATNFLVNSEGSVLRTPEDLASVRILARGLAPDGTQVRDATVVEAFEAGRLPSEAELTRHATEVAEHVSALAEAPAGEAYDGPVLFEAPAAAQLFGQLLGDNLKITRKPIADAGRNAPYVQSELENRAGSRILPEWMDVVDDPTQTEWRGQTLLGHYSNDIEGVSPAPLTLVEKGTLKTFFLTRTPVLKGFEASNGRARMTGAYGADAPGFGNLFIRASQTVPLSDLRKKLMDLCRERNKPYGILVRKLDYPSSASVDELRHLVQSSGGARPVTLPLLVYRLYPDGREELVRGLQFHGVTTRSLKDIAAASDESYVFDFIDSNAPFALMGAGSFVTSASVIAPSLLFDELELEPIQEEVPKPPIVPPPTLGGVKETSGS